MGVKSMTKFYKYMLIFAFGAAGYGAIEIAFRGKTHWTMLITGGICFTLIYLIAVNKKMKVWVKWTLGGIVITVIEFMVGSVVNIGLGWRVWSYANMPYNLLGQICPTFSLLWCLLCIPMMWICSKVEREIKR